VVLRFHSVSIERRRLEGGLFDEFLGFAGKQFLFGRSFLSPQTNRHFLQEIAHPSVQLKLTLSKDGEEQQHAFEMTADKLSVLLAGLFRFSFLFFPSSLFLIDLFSSQN
jgi:hypothetical protein